MVLSSKPLAEMIINDLPDDCLFLIFEECALQDLVRLRLVCTRWRSLIGILCAAVHTLRLFASESDVDEYFDALSQLNLQDISDFKCSNKNSLIIFLPCYLNSITDIGKYESCPEFGGSFLADLFPNICNLTYSNGNCEDYMNIIETECVAYCKPICSKQYEDLKPYHIDIENLMLKWKNKLKTFTVCNVPSRSVANCIETNLNNSQSIENLHIIVNMKLNLSPPLLQRIKRLALLPQFYSTTFVNEILSFTTNITYLSLFGDLGNVEIISRLPQLTHLDISALNIRNFDVSQLNKVYR